jgi:hypothetical protein
LPGDKADERIVGDTFWCDYKIVEDQLYVKGPICIYDDWFATGDLVTLDINKKMFYLGRTIN